MRRRGIRLGAALASAFVLLIGLTTLIGLLARGSLGDTLLINQTFIPGLTQIILQIVVITVALAVLIGVLNLVLVHLRRLTTRKGNPLYSLILLVSFFAVVGLTIFERLNPPAVLPSPSMILLETVQVSIESALAGLLLFALVYGAYRVMRHRATLWGALFVVTLLTVLLAELYRRGVGTAVLESVANVAGWLAAVPVSAGARGILLGVALATAVAGVRVLLGQDRSYRE